MDNKSEDYMQGFRDAIEKLENTLGYLPPLATRDNFLNAIRIVLKGEPGIETNDAQEETNRLLRRGYDAALATTLVYLSRPEMTKEEIAKEIRGFLEPEAPLGTYMNHPE
jgi:hypothetical protein